MDAKDSTMADELRRAIYDWIRDDLGTAAKLTISAKQVEGLLARITRSAPEPVNYGNDDYQAGYADGRSDALDAVAKGNR